MKCHFAELFAPAGADLHEARIRLQEGGAVEVAAAVEEDFAVAGEAVDQVATEFVRVRRSGRWPAVGPRRRRLSRGTDRQGSRPGVWRRPAG